MERLSLPTWVPAPVHQFWEWMTAYPLTSALSLLAVGLVLAWLIRTTIRIVGARLSHFFPGDLDDRLTKVLSTVVALIIVYLSLYLAIVLLDVGPSIETAVVRVLFSLMVLQLMRKAMKLGAIFIDGLSQLQNRFEVIEPRTIPLFNLITSVGVIGVASYALLMIWNIDPTAWLASAGVIGIAVGFAARDTLANLFSGFFIIADSPYQTGDYVVLDTGDRGEITQVGVRSTRMLTRDDVEITIPNAEMANAKIYNESGGRWEKFRIRIKVSVAYGSDLDQVVEILEGLAAHHETVSRSPTPRVRMRGFGDSSLDFELLCWVDLPASRGLVTHQLCMKIYKAFNEAGVQIPFAQREVWLRNESPNAAELPKD
ncbi:MAG: mechanosensitive ion channel family protein [Pseudomonadota bacterium]